MVYMYLTSTTHTYYTHMVYIFIVSGISVMVGREGLGFDRGWVGTQRTQVSSRGTSETRTIYKQQLNRVEFILI